MHSGWFLEQSFNSSILAKLKEKKVPLVMATTLPPPSACLKALNLQNKFKRRANAPQCSMLTVFSSWSKKHVMWGKRMDNYLMGWVRRAVFKSSTILFLISVSSSSKTYRVCICLEEAKKQLQIQHGMKDHRNLRLLSNSEFINKSHLPTKIGDAAWLLPRKAKSLVTKLGRELRWLSNPVAWQSCVAAQMW